MLEISGQCIQDCLDAIQGDDSVIDFNRILPMPDILRGTHRDGGRVLELSTPEEVDAFLLKDGWQIFGYTAAELKERLCTGHCESLEARSRQAELETGYRDWHDWSVANWGTQWPAYDTSIFERRDNLAVIQFRTAWSPPLPLIGTLSTQWPGLRFKLFYDEFLGGMSGELTIHNGQGRWLQYDIEWVSTERGEESRRGKLVVDRCVPSPAEPAEASTRVTNGNKDKAA